MMRLEAIIFGILASKCSSTFIGEATPSGRFLRNDFDDTEQRALQGLPTLDDIVLSDPDLTTLKTAFEASGVVGALCPKCNYTLFAPNNDAFAAFNQDFLEVLLSPSWILHLQNFLSFHVTYPTKNGERLLTTDFVDGQIFDMLNNETVTATVQNKGITLTSPLTNGSQIVEEDILASNGVLDKVETVLSPGFFGIDVFALGKVNEELSIIEDLLKSIGLFGISGEFTVLAPTNEAFLALGNETLTALLEDKVELGKVLVNHIIIGVYPSIFLKDKLVLESLGGFQITVTVTNDTISFNDGTVVQANILASNGIGHAIDMVLLDTNLASDIPSETPSDVPSGAPSTVPSNFPSSYPSTIPSNVPSDIPTISPTISMVPSDSPTAPTVPLNELPSSIPSAAPSDSPSEVPSAVPSQIPSNIQSIVPSSVPSNAPSDIPSAMPSGAPSDSPSDSPSDTPSASPSSSPSDSPTIAKKSRAKKEAKKIGKMNVKGR
jgi:uncharacterized surface protein with fasciclin (FAS1) repeats